MRILFALLLYPFLASAANEEVERLRNCVVRISVAAQSPDYRQPWSSGSVGGGVGSGFLIGERQIMTNAHVVSNSRLITVERDGDPNEYPAQILHIAHDCDLALLTVEDPSFFKGMASLSFGDIPDLHSTVTTYGYPIGGERMSVTRGVVSRIEFRTYSHSSLDAHLAIQIDAAINPGNSGGPVLQDGKCVGVAFQGLSGAVAQNTGYMIPTPVMKRFVKDIEDGSYDGYVELAVNYQTLQNPALRRSLALVDDDTGVLVTSIPQVGSAHGALQVDDVLIAIDGHRISSDGQIVLDGGSVQLEEIVERKFHGDIVCFGVIRNRETIDVDVTLKGAWPYRILAKTYDVRPRFVLFAGLLFQPVDRNFLSTYSIDDLEVMYRYSYFVSDEIYLDHPEIVVFSEMIPDSINSYFRELRNGVVEEVNGKTIRGLADLAEAIDQDVAHHVIRLVGQGRPLVIEAAQVEAARQRILSTYGITQERYLGLDQKQEEQK
ncbi:MAG TPA: serine protease [Lentisphaeria bacterium]|jgi:S1-C subfamily serine protease|nr:serine protease [Lentisphaeria bacterium]